MEIIEKLSTDPYYKFAKHQMQMDYWMYIIICKVVNTKCKPYKYTIWMFPKNN